MAENQNSLLRHLLRDTFLDLQSDVSVKEIQNASKQRQVFITIPYYGSLRFFLTGEK